MVVRFRIEPKHIAEQCKRISKRGTVATVVERGTSGSLSSYHVNQLQKTRAIPANCHSVMTTGSLE